MGLFASKRARGAGEETLSLDVVASRPKLEPHEVAALRLTSHGTYATLAAHVYGAGAPATATQVDLPAGWEVLLQCSSLHLDREGYFAVAYIHRPSRHCVIAQRGTSEVLGLRAGVWMYFEQPTIQFFLAEQFSKAVRHTLATREGGRGGEWFLTYTGHSLGAVLASSRAVEEGTLAVTFESPGARAFIEKMRNSVEGLETCTVAYLRAPNPINTLKPHCGYGIVIPTQQVRLPSGTLFLAPSLLPPPADEDEGVMRGGSVPSRGGSSANLLAAPPTSAARPDSAAGAEGAAVTGRSAEAPRSSAAGPLLTGGGGAERGAGVPLEVGGAEETVALTDAKTSNSSSSGGSGIGKQAKGKTTPTALNAKASTAASRWRIPSFRPQQYLRGYVFSGVGLGIPELQQYVSKVEPMIREMLEHTQQVHSIHSMRVHFDKEDEPGDEEVVLRWPEHLLQFMEFYNTFRALEDPENQDAHVREAYRGMMRRLYSTEPRRRDCIPVRFVDSTSLLVVRLWWSMDAAQRKLWSLTFLDHKALNMIQIKDGHLCSYVLSALQAKQYLLRLVSRTDIATLIEQWRRESLTAGPLPTQSRL